MPIRFSALPRLVAGPLCAAALLSACGDTWLGASGDPALPGKRVSVLAHARSLKAEPELVAAISLPRPYRNPSWPQSGGYANSAMHHLEAAEALRPSWSADAGAGIGARDRLLASPVVAEGVAYAVDAEASVSAFDAADGKRLWETSLVPEEEEDTVALMGGGIAVDGGRLFATSGFGEVVALETKTGRVLWRKTVGAPVRAAPTVSGERVFVVNKDNEVRALAVDDGRELWKYTGMVEITSLVGAPAPAVEGSVVLAAMTSGELVALRTENGSSIWSDTLAAIRRTDSVANMADIAARPVIDRGRVFAIGHSGIMVAIDLRTGNRLWDVEVGGSHQPWVAGDYLFVLSNAPALLALEAQTGRIAWITELPPWEDEEDHSGRILWTGPVLAGDRLIVAASQGLALSVSPYTGKVLGREEMPSAVSIAPVLADGTLYFLTDDADLVAYR